MPTVNIDGIDDSYDRIKKCFSSYVRSSLFSTSMGETNNNFRPPWKTRYSLESVVVVVWFEALLISCRYSVAWVPHGVVHKGQMVMSWGETWTLSLA